MGKSKKERTKKIKNAGGLSRTKVDLSKFVTTDTGPCASNKENLGIGICSSPNIVVAMVQYNNSINGPTGEAGGTTGETGATGTTDIINELQNTNSITDVIKKNSDIIKNKIEAVKKKLKCDNELCVVTNPEFTHFAINSHIVNKSELNENLNTRFKPKGPRNNNDWLSNEDIDKTLQDWACKFEDFYPCPFAMIDFNKTNSELNRHKMNDIYLGKYHKSTILGNMKVPCRTFGCAINSDVSSGDGIHWMALFIDMRPQDEEPWTIEYFNSAASSPQDSITEWMDNKKLELEEIIRNFNKNNKVIIANVHKLEHQMSSTECGVYTLFYIRSRLENVPYTTFLQEIIPDGSMEDFRKHCFN